MAVNAQGSLFSSVNINPGTTTIYSYSLADNRRAILQAGLRRGPGGIDAAFSGGNISAMLNQLAEYNNDVPNYNMGQFMYSVAQMAAGRGVNKYLYSPALYNGFRPYNPGFFNMQPKQPVPYQKIINQKNNLAAVLRGYQEHKVASGGSVPDNTGNLLANVQRSGYMIYTILDKQKNESIYTGVPRDAAHNLFNINVNNMRRDSIYALY